MILTLNPNISVRRKIAYVGVMLFIGALILASMGDPIDASDDRIFKVASILGVGGFSLLLLAISFKNIRDKYRYIGIAGTLAISSVIPVICVVCLYLLGETLFESSTAEKHIIDNAALIFAINIPLVILAALLLIRTRCHNNNKKQR